MSKLRSRLSKWFLDTAKKLDESTVYDNCTIPIPSRNEPFIVYDQYHVDKIHAQHQIANAMLDSYKQCVSMNVEDMIYRKLSEAIGNEIFKNYAGEIKKTQMIDSPWNESTLYSLDVYVCKPTKKETF